jgi:hypothetical protein
MVTTGTAFLPETSVDLGQTALEAAAEIWVLLEAAELMPTSAETQAELLSARRDFRDRLEQLEITEQMLCHHLKAKVAPTEPPGGSAEL